MKNKPLFVTTFFDLHFLKFLFYMIDGVRHTKGVEKETYTKKKMTKVNYFLVFPMKRKGGKEEDVNQCEV